MPAVGGERATVQNPLIRYAEEAGWSYLPPDEALRLRRGETGLLPRAEELAKRLALVAPNIEGNLQAWEYLKGLRTVFVELERRQRNVRLLALQHPQRNTFQVTDEFSFTNGVETNRPDIIFLINGIPILDVETKAATHPEA